ncbi:hypothetical protein JMG10_38660, partial [Nostoc ellipsosporum NOK]|nr:hypothetical protein [Nostoc ellipsosporum NOK]
IEISAKEAVDIIDATLKIFELISGKFYNHLERVLHYPEFEEGYSQYYDQLEDKSSFFEE